MYSSCLLHPGKHTHADTQPNTTADAGERRWFIPAVPTLSESLVFIYVKKSKTPPSSPPFPLCLQVQLTFACEFFSNSHGVLLPGPALLFAFVPAGLHTFSLQLPTAQLSESSTLVLRLALKALGERSLAAPLPCSLAPFLYVSPFSGWPSLCLSVSVVISFQGTLHADWSRLGERSL